MKAVILAVLLVATTWAEIHPVNHAIVAEIKAMATTWTPMEPEENPFAYKSIEQIKAMMGTKIALTETIEEDLGFTPNDEFDARKQWGSKIHPIRNQGQCGSCWAFGATEAMSDRWAIDNDDVILSPQHMVSCDKNNYGCQGGYLNYAWNFITGTGVVDDDCYPYTSGKSGQDGACKAACANSNKPFKPKKSTKGIHPTSVKATQQQIQQFGPVEAAFTVYQDFMSYKSGVYQHKTGGLLGGHAIKCLGWGTENGVDYWLMANSWDTTWGDKGFFKIKRGDCGVDAQMYAAHTK